MRVSIRWPRSNLPKSAAYCLLLTAYCLRRERDLHRLRGLLCRTMEYRLDIVAIRIHHESSVISRMIGARTRRTIVAPTGRQCRLVEAIDNLPVLGLESQMHAAGQSA